MVLWAKEGAVETLIDQTKAKRADLVRAKGTVTSVSSSIRMEAVRLASRTATVTAEEEASSPAAAVETGDDAVAVAVEVEPRRSSAARIEGPRVRIPRIASDSNRRRRLDSEGTACTPRLAIRPPRGRSGMAVKEITALKAVRSYRRCGGGCCC